MTSSAQSAPLHFAAGLRGAEQRRLAAWHESRSSETDPDGRTTAFLRDSSPPSFNPLVTLMSQQAPLASSAEVIGGHLARNDRALAGRLLANLGLPDAEKELAEIEAHLLSSDRRTRKHAAFSARQLLEEVADRLFPAQSADYTDRFGEERLVGQSRVGNRLLAFVDRQRTLSAREQRAVGAAAGVIADWTGSGAHTAWTAERSNRAYAKLLEVLAAVAEAFDASFESPR